MTLIATLEESTHPWEASLAEPEIDRPLLPIPLVAPPGDRTYQLVDVLGAPISHLTRQPRVLVGGQPLAESAVYPAGDVRATLADQVSYPSGALAVVDGWEGGMVLAGNHTNYATYSALSSLTSWSNGSNLSLRATTIQAPNGSPWVELVEGLGTMSAVARSVAAVANTPLRYGWLVRRGTRQYVRLTWWIGGNGGAAVFDLTNGSVVSATSVGSGTAPTAGCVVTPAGHLRIWMDSTFPGPDTVIYLRPCDAAGNSVTGVAGAVACSVQALRLGDPMGRWIQTGATAVTASDGTYNQTTGQAAVTWALEAGGTLTVGGQACTGSGTAWQAPATLTPQAESALAPSAYTYANGTLTVTPTLRTTAGAVAAQWYVDGVAVGSPSATLPMTATTTDDGTLIHWETSYQRSVPAVLSVSTGTHASQAFAARVAVIQSEPTPGPGCVVFGGSSTVQGWTALASSFPASAVKNCGMSGGTFGDLLYWSQALLLDWQPGQVVMINGDNDIAAGVAPATVALNVRRLLRRIPPGTSRIVCGLKPSPSRWGLQAQFDAVDTLLAQVCADEGALFLPQRDLYLLNGTPDPACYSDGLHLSAEGYRRLSDRVRPHLLTALAPVPAAGRAPLLDQRVQAGAAVTWSAVSTVVPPVTVGGVVATGGPHVWTLPCLAWRAADLAAGTVTLDRAPAGAVTWEP